MKSIKNLFSLACLERGERRKRREWGKTHYLLVLLWMVFLSLGNVRCETKEERVLKMRVSVQKDGLENTPIKFSSSRKFDLGFVAYRQIVELLHKSGRYVVVEEELQSDDMQFYREWSGMDRLPNHGSACLLSYPQAYIRGTIYAFEMKSRSGLHLSLEDIHSMDIDTKFQVEKAQMDLQLWATSPLKKGGGILGMGSGKANQNEYNFDLSLSKLFALGGYEYYRKTPMADVTRKALQSALVEMHQEMQNGEHEWFSRVIVDNDDYMLVRGGILSGLKKGDQLAVYNEEIRWDGNGNPCDPHSRSNYFSLPTAEPVAIIELDRLGPDISEGFVVERLSHDDAHVGAIVKLHSFSDLQEEEEEDDEEEEDTGYKVSKR